AQLASGDPKRANEAVSAFDAFVKANPNSRQTVPAIETLTQLYLRKGQYADADKALTAMAKVGGAADRAAVLRARVLTRQGKFDEALAKLDAMLGDAPETTPKGREARLAKAEALAGQKKYPDAEKLAKDVIKAVPVEDAD